VSGDVGSPLPSVYGSYLRVLTVQSQNYQKSESEMSVLLDDEPPKRRRKAKGEKDEAVRAPPRSYFLG